MSRPRTGGARTTRTCQRPHRSATAGSTSVGHRCAHQIRTHTSIGGRTAKSSVLRGQCSLRMGWCVFGSTGTPYPPSRVTRSVSNRSSISSIGLGAAPRTRLGAVGGQRTRMLTVAVLLTCLRVPALESAASAPELSRPSTNCSIDLPPTSSQTGDPGSSRAPSSVIRRRSPSGNPPSRASCTRSPRGSRRRVRRRGRSNPTVR